MKTINSIRPNETDYWETVIPNAKDAKIFNALSKANLRKGILYLKTKNDRKALEALKSVCNSSSLSFKQGLYKLEALVVLGEYYFSVQNTIEVKSILRKDFIVSNAINVQNLDI